MLKKICSLLVVFIMAISLSSAAFAEYAFIDGFSQGNLPAKQIEIWNNYAIVVSGEGSAALDKLNVYDLTTKELVASLGVPIYSTGKTYFAQEIGISGDTLLVSWNRNGGSGDPSVRQYDLNDVVAGNLEHIKSTGVRDDKTAYVYGDKIYFTDPVTINISSLGVASGRHGFMAVPSKEEVKNIKGLRVDDEYFYIFRDNEIRVYSAENIHSGVNHSYEDTLVVYKSEKVINDITLYEGNLYVSYENGLEILKVEGEELKSVGSYTQGGKIMAVEGVGNTLYVYAEGTKSIQLLDISNLSSITVKEEITVNNTQTEGVVDIAVSGQRIYAADLTEGFTLYSANELDNLEKLEAVAESYAEELEISSKSKAIELVVGLRIMDLRSDGLFGSNLYITRGEFAMSAAKLMGDTANGVIAADRFTDVPNDSQYASGVYALVGLGILNGFGDGTFRPDDPISYEHAVRIVIKALGYYPIVESSNRTTVEIASELGILKNVEAMSNGFISRENIAQLIYNSLETPTLRFVSGLDPYAYEKSQSDTLLYKMRIKKIKGQVTATEFTSLTGTYTAAKGKVEINQIQYPEGSSGAGSLLGRNVTAYHKFDGDINEEIIYVVKDNNDSVITVNAEDIEPETSKAVFVYTDEREKIQRENIQNASIIYNGKFHADYTTLDLMPDDGQVTLIDADDAAGIDTVIIESYKTYITEAYGSGIFKLKYGFDDIDLNTLSSKAKMLVVVDGYVYDSIDKIANIKTWSVLSVKESLDKGIVEIYVTNSVVSGIVRNVVANKTATIDGTEYKISKSLIANVAKPENNLSPIGAGDEIFAYIDHFGKIAATSPCVQSAKYGFMVGCTRGKGLDTDKAEFKILARDENHLFGSMQEFESAENMKINGQKAEDIHAVTELFDPQTGFKRQIVKFLLSADGKVKEIYTAVDRVNETLEDGSPNPNYDANYAGIDETQFTYDALVSKSSAYRVGSMNTFEGEPFLPDSDTEIFVVPASEDAKDEEYRIVSFSNMFKSGGTHQDALALYDITEDYTISAIVMQGSAAGVDVVGASSPYAVIDSFIRGLNEDGEERWVVKHSPTAEGEYTETPIMDENLADTAGSVNASYAGKRLIDLPKGSVIQYVENSAGEIATFRVLYIPEADKTYFEFGQPNKPTATNMSLTYYSAFGKVIKVTESRVIWNAGGMLVNGDITTANRKWDRNLKAPSAIYLFDSSTNRIRRITIDDILPGDDMLITKQSVYSRLIVIYR